MADKDYEIGYKKPPKDTRFKPGQSGNKNGRPKKRGNTELDVDAVLNDKVKIKTAQGEQRLDSRELQLRAVLAKAIKGDIAAIRYLLEQFEKYDAVTTPIQPKECGIVVIPTNTIPFKVGTIALHLYGRPPWSEKQLQPIIEDYLANRSEAERVEDERMEYKL